LEGNAFSLYESERDARSLGATDKSLKQVESMPMKKRERWMTLSTAIARLKTLAKGDERILHCFDQEYPLLG
jgi:hypothetical protein